MEKDLLDELAEAVGICYLSDLRQVENFERIVLRLERMDERVYPEKQWKEAINYILGKNAGKPGVEESPKEYLCRILRKIY